MGHMHTVRIPRVTPRATFATTLLMVVALVVAVGNAQATGGPLFQHFELDENLVDDGSADDWETLFDETSTDTAFAAASSIPIADNDSIDSLATGTVDTSYFHGGGSKDVNDVSQWGYSANDVAPDKNEILNAFAAGYVADVGAGEDDTIIYFGLDRYSNDGDAAVGFWFFRNRVSLDGNGGFSGVHSPGDVFVVSDFSAGGTVSTIHVWEWVGGNKQNSLELVHSTDLAGSQPADCTDPNHHEHVCATANKGDEEGVWPFMAKPSALGPDTPSGGYPQGTLLEGGINITQLLPESDGCFASFLAETRSSTSETAQLKDFALGDLPLCAPGTDLTASSSTDSQPTHEGETVTLTFTETNDGEGPAQFIGLSNVSVDTDSTECDGTMTDPAGDDGAGDADMDGVLGGDEAWVFTCTVTAGSVDSTVTGIGHGTFDGKDVTFCEGGVNPDPDTILCDADEIATATIDVIEPGTDLSISADPTTVRSDDVITLTVTETNDGVNPGEVSTEASDLDLTNVSVLVSGQSTGCGDPLTASDLDTGVDVGGDGVLSVGETWTWTCDVTMGANSGAITATATGDDIHGHPVTVCDPAPGGGDGTLVIDTVCDSEEEDAVDITVINPSTTLVQEATVDITYTIHEINDGDSALTAPDPVAGGDYTTEGWLDTPGCSDLTFVSGDTGGDHVLGSGEHWIWTCTKTLDLALNLTENGSITFADTGSVDFTNVVTGHGVDASGNDVTFASGQAGHDPDERDSVKVTLEYLGQG